MEMEMLVTEARHVAKKQRVCMEQLDVHLDALLHEVEDAKSKVQAQQREFKRKQRKSNEDDKQEGKEVKEVEQGTSESKRNSEHEEEKAGKLVETETKTQAAIGDEIDAIVQEFVDRVQLLNLEKSVAEDLKGLHVALSKYGKHIDKLLDKDVVKICRTTEPDHQAVCQLIAEYLYHDGQIAAADSLCDEAGITISKNYRECFVQLHEILKSLRQRDMEPALAWSREHRDDLEGLHVNIEFELVKLKYLDLLESCSDVVKAVKFANAELSRFHATHPKEIGRLMSCVLFKDRFEDSPYKDLFQPNRWDRIEESMAQACCQLYRVPHRAYLKTCISAGITALPAMRKLLTVLDSKVARWDSMEELPVELPLQDEHRFHSVFACPVSKEESTPENPPMLLKCGHVICKSCVTKISFNMTRRFKCPTCPMEQTENETRELFF